MRQILTPFSEYTVSYYPEECFRISRSHDKLNLALIGKFDQAICVTSPLNYRKIFSALSVMKCRDLRWHVKKYIILSTPENEATTEIYKG